MGSYSSPTVLPTANSPRPQPHNWASTSRLIRLSPGRKGRSRLAVVDGVVNEAVVRLVVGALPEGERVVICGTGIDVESRPILRRIETGFDPQERSRLRCWTSTGPLAQLKLEEAKGEEAVRLSPVLAAEEPPNYG